VSLHFLVKMTHNVCLFYNYSNCVKLRFSIILLSAGPFLFANMTVPSKSNFAKLLYSAPRNNKIRC
jgi:hypothetical protein